MEEAEGERKPAPVRAVIIPARAEHEGIYSRIMCLRWVCPVCGAPRGVVVDTTSFDGSRRLQSLAVSVC